MQWSQWREWWYTARGKPILPDRWRLWNMWEEHNFTAYSAKFRSTPWVQTILKRMQCPPRPYSLWSRAPAHADVPESSVQGPGFYLKPLPPATPAPKAKKRPLPPPSSAPPSPPTQPKKIKLMPTSKARPKAKTSAESNGQRDAATQEASSPSGSAQSSGPPAEGAGQERHNIPWPCAVCGQMPWKCRCQGKAAKSEEVILEEYADMCKRAGVWDRAEAQQREAEERAVEENPPAPDHPRTLWCCQKCKTMNTVHELRCSVASCGAWRPLTQRWREDMGDWICEECGNHNWGKRRWCNWTACPTNNWRCVCGNLNRSNRKLCNRFVCQLPRPFGYA